MTFGARVAWAAAGIRFRGVVPLVLITTLILEELRSTGTISLGNFLARRARRLLPALALVLAVTLLASALFWRDSLAEVKSGVIASAAYVQNWWLIFDNQDYFGFVEEARATGIDVPIIPGIWPVTNYTQIKRIAELCAELLGGPIVVAVSHVSPIKAGALWAMGGDPLLAWRMHLDVASITRVAAPHGRPCLLGFNDTAHLA